MKGGALKKRRLNAQSASERQISRKLKHVAAKHGLCSHGAEMRAYASHSEVEADPKPAQTCPKCGKEKIVAAIVFKGEVPNVLPEGVTRGGVAV